MEKRLMKCPKCQAENPETKQFCGDCGTRLEKAVGERDPYLSGLKYGHRFDALRADPRFTDLLRRIGLEK